MKCINKLLVLCSIFPILIFTGCNKEELPCRFERNSSSSSISVSDSSSLYQYSETFAKNLCIDDEIYKELDLQSAYAAGLFDINKNCVVYGKNMYEEMTPASITKLLTTLVALKYCNLEDTVVFTKNCEITEAGAQKIGFKEGETLTMEQALNILLIYSANDVAMMIADSYEGGYEAFIELMNAEAQSIGATHTHYCNPHGLTEEGHVTCVYDLYLIMNELIKYDKFKEIASSAGYITSYTKSDGSIKTLEINSTNMYINGSKETPEGYTVLAGKTGTTMAAGKCLILYFKDSDQNPYIACILRAEDYDLLYSDMDTLIEGTKLTK